MTDDTSMDDGSLTEADIKQYLALSDRIRAEAFCNGYSQATADLQSWISVYGPDVPASANTFAERLLAKVAKNADRYEEAYKVLPRIQQDDGA